MTEPFRDSAPERASWAQELAIRLHTSRPHRRRRPQHRCDIHGVGIGLNEIVQHGVSPVGWRPWPPYADNLGRSAFTDKRRLLTGHVRESHTLACYAS